MGGAFAGPPPTPPPGCRGPRRRSVDSDPVALELPSLVDVGTLAEHLQDPALRVFDTTVILSRPPAGGPYTVHSGRPGYDRAHIAGASFADIPGELSDPDSALMFTLPSAE